MTNYDDDSSTPSSSAPSCASTSTPPPTSSPRPGDASAPLTRSGGSGYSPRRMTESEPPISPLANTDPDYRHPTGGQPRRVVLLALGQSLMQYFNDRHSKMRPAGHPGSGTYYDEIWVVNRAIKTLGYHVAWILDDLRSECVRDPEYGVYIRRATAHLTGRPPVLTSTPYPEFPGATGYPLLGVSQAVGAGACYWHNSIPLIIAYAWAIGVQELTLYGVDYTHPDQLAGEAERGSAEFMVGWVRAKGMTVRVSRGSSLLNTREGFHDKLYGWLIPPEDYVQWLRSVQD